MPWGALSGACLVRGHKRVFWGRGGGVRATVAQYLRYLHILMDTYKYTLYLHIHAYTCRYLPIPRDMYRYLLVCAGIVGMCWYFLNCRYN
jgi:hypothetical protein